MHGIEANGEGMIVGELVCRQQCSEQQLRESTGSTCSLFVAIVSW